MDEGPREGTERWRRVEALYNRMLALPASERAAVLASACEDDPSLAAEVQSLLDQPESAAGFLKRDVLDIAAGAVSPAGASMMGRRIGSFEVRSLIGIGGMGEVYRAHDSKLGRDVAIKVLPSSVAKDADRLSRFRREARLLASLNHPNIASIHGLEESDGTFALVMEMVEGEDLAERLKRGSIPVDEAIAIARQVAEGLEAAHEKGIVHRDLKPANIKLTKDGGVKILDFGLAKAYEVEGRDAEASALSDSPTMSRRMTEAGAILGTAAYMSPEQARGMGVDRRADTWAFGVILFEMLAGTPPFRGASTSDILAEVLKSAPDWNALPPLTPPSIRRLLRRCIEKDPKKRLHSSADARLDLDEASSATGEALPDAGAAAALRGSPLPWVIMGALAALSLSMFWPTRGDAPLATPRRLLAHLGVDQSVPTGFGPSVVLAPDGGLLTFVAQESGVTRLFVRSLDGLRASPIAGTEGAEHPFFSPDGKWIAFFSNGSLKRVSVNGGLATTLCAASAGRGGVWSDDDSIIFQPSSGNLAPLMRVASTGGAPQTFSTLSPGAQSQRWPQMLPGSAGVLATENASSSAWDSANIVVIPKTGGVPKVVVTGAYFGRYVPTGHLLYMKKGSMFGVRFDLDRLETLGSPAPVLDGIAANPAPGGAQISFSSDGTAVYVPGAVTTVQRTLDWMTRDGATSPLRPGTATWVNPRFSPDGRRVSLDISEGGAWDVWVYEWARDTLSQLTFAPGADEMSTWTPDGSRIVFASDRGKAGVTNLYWVSADGSGEVTRLTDSPLSQIPLSWHPSGRLLSIMQASPGGGMDLMTLPVTATPGGGLAAGTPALFLPASAGGSFPLFSPDGRWIAYASTEGGGAVEVYVRPFPGPGGKWRVSSQGGNFPHWSAKTPELLFTNQGRIWVAPYSVSGGSFRAETPRLWAPAGYAGDPLRYPYDIHPDGKRLVLEASRDRSGDQDEVVFILNFFDYLRKLMPGARS